MPSPPGKMWDIRTCDGPVSRSNLTMRHVGFDAASSGSCFHLRIRQLFRVQTCLHTHMDQSLDASDAKLDDPGKQITRENQGKTSNWQIPKGLKSLKCPAVTIGDSPRAEPSSALFALRSNRTCAINAIGCEISISAADRWSQKVKWAKYG